MKVTLIDKSVDDMLICSETKEQLSLRPEETKLEEVKNFPTPTTKKQVQSFMGLCNAFNK